MAKKKNKGQQTQQHLSPEQFIKQKARALEIGPCYLTDDLTDMKEGYVVVTRRHTGGRVSLAMFLVDVYCLGVKDSFYRLRMDPEEFEDFVESIPRVKECTYNEAHNWVYGSIAFAEEAGIEPDKSFNLTQYMLEEDTDDIPLIEYEFGKNGKHFLMCHTNLEASKYLPLLKKNLGDNFDFAINMDDENGWDELEDFDENFQGVDLKDHPLFNPNAFETEYTYQHPEYPKALSEADRALEKMISNLAEGTAIRNKTITDILSQPHDIIRAQLERIILYHIGQTCDEITDDYDKDGFSAIIPLSVALLGEVGNEDSSLEVLLEILRQNNDFYEYHLSDWSNEIMIPALYKIGSQKLDRLMEFIHEPGLYRMFKYLVFCAVTSTCLLQPERREEIINWYREVVVYTTEVLPKKQYIDSTLAGFIASELIGIQAKELLPEIKKMFDTQLVDGIICGNYANVSKSICNPDDAGKVDRSLFDIYKQIKEILKSLSSLYPSI